MPDLDFRILGALEAQRGGEALPLGREKQRALLGRLRAWAQFSVDQSKSTPENSQKVPS
jgi:hypothetical protein